VRTREQLPQDWAATQNNLGIVFRHLGEPTEGTQTSQYLRQAVDAFHNALLVRTREQLPQDWAATQNNLGLALGDLARRSEDARGPEYLQQAVDAFRSALQVYTQSAFPTTWTGVNRNLANAYEAKADWANAYKCYEQLLSHNPTSQYLQTKVKELSDKR
jgi:tetratricopeptide (TPR) repeat protein